eukprot:NODE_469_length_7049_cov_0.468489.p12 type:complete len:112 gc:universal NODE_469_length_7049_cov_0.468489:6711-6376(-)
MWDCVSIVVPYDIQETQLSQLNDKMCQFFKENSVDYTGPCGMDYASLVDNHRMDLNFWYECRGNWQNTGLKGQRRIRAFNKIRELAKELNIKYTPLAQPVQVQTIPSSFTN